MAKKKSKASQAAKRSKPAASEFAVYTYESVREQDLDQVIAEIKASNSDGQFFKYDALPEKSGKSYTIVAVYRH